MVNKSPIDQAPINKSEIPESTFIALMQRVIRKWLVTRCP
jgi:hypothetical protein